MNNVVLLPNSCHSPLQNNKPNWNYSQENGAWKQEGKKYAPGVIGLHAEIKDFVSYISPTHEERWVREIVVAKIKQTIYAQWPNCHVDVFGSSKTMLFLPTSDIDMVIFGKWETLPFRTLERIIRNSGVASHIKVLSRATVPIFKLTDADTGLHVDISFNMENSVRTADLICNYIKEFPSLPYLVFVLKQFILQHNLNEVWTGGISSYALLLMIISFLQHTNDVDILEELNFGSLLMDFFNLYGRKFDYTSTAIRVRDGGSYVSKEDIQENMKAGSLPSILCIEDPLCPGNDVGRGSFGASQVQKVFANAYTTLEAALIPCPDNDLSLLSRILHISSITEHSRDRVRCYARQLYLILPHFIFPALSNYKRNWGTCEKTDLPHSLGRATTTIQRNSSTTSSLNGNCHRKTTKNEPIVVSAKGYPVQTPQIVWPYSADVFRLSPLCPYLYPQHALLYDGILRQQPNVIPISSSQKLVSPFMFLLPDSLQTCPNKNMVSNLHDFQSEFADNIPSKIPEFDSDSSGILNDQRSQTSLHQDSSSEECNYNKTTHQKSSDCNKRALRSSSVLHQLSDLSDQLAPLRLVSSAQNVSQSEPSSTYEGFSPQTGTLSSEEADSAACSIDESRRILHRKQIEQPQKNNRGRYSRRRRRPVRHCDKYTATSDDFPVTFDLESRSKVFSETNPRTINRWCSEFAQNTTSSSTKKRSFLPSNIISKYQDNEFKQNCSIINSSIHDENIDLVKSFGRKKMLRT